MAISGTAKTVPCPCGCGRYIGERRLGPATQYPELGALLRMATPAIEWFLDHDAEVDDWRVHQLAAQKARAGCERVLGYHVDHLHGTASAGRTPDLGMLLMLTSVARTQLLEVVETSQRLGGPGLYASESSSAAV
jgi:hypothetical protein